MSYALGILETYGYLPAIAGVDSALKSANVGIKSVQLPGGGLVTILIQGDVAAVKASVEAGSATIESIGVLVSHHVIARLDKETEKLFYGSINSCTGQEQKKDLTELLEPKKQNLVPKNNESLSKQKLDKLKVTELRRIARSFENFAIESKNIKFANKSQLIKAILEKTQPEVE
ncbi:BMC domain-containing protein [Proteinivorax tanatarense]|uniref:BMC domain-containing protein n=1 Tax=Proteinivorax tanatarense TaxID=1260629 RepID=A0AAU7VJN3_9FIRM